MFQLFTLSLGMQHNVRRYVAVAAESRWRVFLHSWCGVELCGYYFILALAKTVTPRGSPPAVPGAARGASHKTASLVTQLSRRGKAMTHTDLLGIGGFAELVSKYIVT